jgi:hypothetical protein
MSGIVSCSRRLQGWGSGEVATSFPILRLENKSNAPLRASPANRAGAATKRHSRHATPCACSRQATNQHTRRVAFQIRRAVVVAAVARARHAARLGLGTYCLHSRPPRCAAGCFRTLPPSTSDCVNGALTYRRRPGRGTRCVPDHRPACHQPRIPQGRLLASEARPALPCVATCADTVYQREAEWRAV